MTVFGRNELTGYVACSACSHDILFVGVACQQRSGQAWCSSSSCSRLDIACPCCRSCKYIISTPVYGRNVLNRLLYDTFDSSLCRTHICTIFDLSHCLYCGSTLCCFGLLAVGDYVTDQRLGKLLVPLCSTVPGINTTPRWR